MKEDILHLTQTDLAFEAGISRSYLYKKAKQIGLELNGKYTQKDIEALKKHPNKRRNMSHKTVSSRVSKRSHETPERDTDIVEVLRQQVSSFQKQINVKDEQLKAKDEQISTANQLANQAQQLQADLQSKLENKNQELIELKKKPKHKILRFLNK